jgi:pyruvate,water dikinase
MGSGRYTRGLDELRGSDAEQFGGKSASLGELIAGEIPVPPGFAVSSTAYRDALEAAGGWSGEGAPPLLDELRAEITAGYARLGDAMGRKSNALSKSGNGTRDSGIDRMRGDAFLRAPRNCSTNLTLPALPPLGTTISLLPDAAIPPQ